MKFLCLMILLSAIWGCSYRSFASPLDEKQDPVLTIEKDQILFKNYSDFVSHSPVLKPVKNEHHKYMRRRVLFALVGSSSLLGLVLLLSSCFWICRLRKPKKCNSTIEQNSDTAEGMIPFGPQSDKYSSLKVIGKKRSVPAVDYQLLMAATNNFDERYVLEGGMLGKVYKAHFNGNYVAAVKRIYARGKEDEREFQSKVESLSKIQHQNIVSLLAYCICDEARFLVYGIMANGSLERHLNGSSRRSKLTWQLRMKIALDVARGLEYLHELCNPSMIHGNLKSSNILLDSNFRAKISGFGLAFSEGNLNETNAAKLSGTMAYVAPEYLLDGKLTDKSDVYAFGVILLELLLGRSPVEKVAEGQYKSIVTWAMPQLTDRSKLPNIIDPAIRYTMDLKHLYQVAAIAVLCVQPESSYRPLITDVLYSFIPLVPVDLGGSLRVTDSPLSTYSSDAGIVC